MNLTYLPERRGLPAPLPLPQANEGYKRLPVRMSCGALESSSPEVKAFEAADAARAEAERDFALDPEQLDK